MSLIERADEHEKRLKEHEARLQHLESRVDSIDRALSEIYSHLIKVALATGAHSTSPGIDPSEAAR